MPSISGITMSVQQKLERLLAQTLVGGEPVVERDHLVAGVLQRPYQEAAHVVVIFRKNDFGHYPAH